MSLTFGIYRSLLLVVISLILVAHFVSAVPSLQAMVQTHQNIRGRPQDVKIPCNFNGVSLSPIRSFSVSQSPDRASFLNESNADSLCRNIV